MQKLLLVKEVFSIGKRGILVYPWLPASFFEGSMLPIQVELRYVDGKTKIKAANFSILRRSSPPEEYHFGCFIKNILKTECPIGTEIWAKTNTDSVNINRIV